MKNFSDIDVYPVTNRALYGARSDEQVIAALAAGGARIVQLREKNVSDREFYDLAALYRRETARHDMMLIINDRPDIALAVGADGVHLGRDDMPIEAARRIMGPDLIIGASTHSVAQALEAEGEGASYVNIGPLFPTPTKPDAKTIGLDPVREAAAKLKIPFTVMGGITEENIDDVLAAGARRIGVITAILGAEDIAGATARLVKRIRGAAMPSGK
ncbi:MAG: thiamine phosphate synthase [Candidatus Nitrospinota bacterium M3_3B_026]